jgi:hypothetical protein
MSLQERIEETDKQVFVDFRPEEFLESEVGIEIDISFSERMCTHGFMALFSAKVHLLLVSSKFSSKNMQYAKSEGSVRLVLASYGLRIPSDLIRAFL